MTPEKQTKDPKAQKQKIIIGIVVVAVLVVIWQFMGMGGGSSAPGPTTPTPVAAAPMAKHGVANSMQAPAASAANMAAPVAAPVPESNQPKPERVSINSDMAKLQQQTQTEYISSINKLQMLKLQREIDETKMAIATAELNRMTAEKSIADLITSKQDIAPEAAPLSTGMPTPQPMPAHAPAVVPEFPYTVLSVSYEGRKWAAVVSASSSGSPGKVGGPPAPSTTAMFTVGVGDILPPDGSTVIAIDKQSVTLKRNNTTRIVPLTSTSM